MSDHDKEDGSLGRQRDSHRRWCWTRLMGGVCDSATGTRAAPV